MCPSHSPPGPHDLHPLGLWEGVETVHIRGPFVFPFVTKVDVVMVMSVPLRYFVYYTSGPLKCRQKSGRDNVSLPYHVKANGVVIGNLDYHGPGYGLKVCTIESVRSVGGTQLVLPFYSLAFVGVMGLDRPRNRSIPLKSVPRIYRSYDETR